MRNAILKILNPILAIERRGTGSDQANLLI
jgi:hypothetical protein